MIRLCWFALRHPRDFWEFLHEPEVQIELMQMKLNLQQMLHLLMEP